MADLHLLIDGIEGTSSAAGHEDEIVLHTWSWNIDPVESDGSITGRTRRNITANEIVIEKALDKASPLLAEAALLGKVYSEMELTGRVPDENGQLSVYLKIRFEKVSVQAVQQSGTVNEQRERLVFRFSEIQYSFTQPGETTDIEFQHSF